MTTLIKFILISLFSGCGGIKICENGLHCVSDDDCQIGNHCKEFVDGKSKSTRCVLRDDLNDTYYCSLTQKSCESKYVFPIIFHAFYIIQMKPFRAVRDSAIPSEKFAALFSPLTVLYHCSSSRQSHQCF